MLKIIFLVRFDSLIMCDYLWIYLYILEHNKKIEIRRQRTPHIQKQKKHNS